MAFFKKTIHPTALILLLIFSAVLLYLFFFTSLIMYVWINLRFLSSLTAVFLLGALFLKINASATDDYPGMGYWIFLALAAGFYYYTWQQPELFAFLFDNFFSMGVFSMKKSNGFCYGLTAWVGLILIFYSWPFLYVSLQKHFFLKKGRFSLPQNNNGTQLKLTSFALSMFFYLLYLNISVTLVSMYFQRY